MSMSAVHRTLYKFWSGFGVDSFLSGHVPDGAQFPYITFEIGNGDALTSGYLTAFDWHRHDGTGRNINAERAELMDAIGEAIPPEGVLLELPGDAGFLMLERNDSGFQQYYDDPEDKAVIGGRTSYRVSYYTI